MSQLRPAIEITDIDLEPITHRATLIGLLSAAHAVAEQLDLMAAAIADPADVAPDSDAITEAVFNMTDAPAAADLLLPPARQPKENLQ